MNDLKKFESLLKRITKAFAPVPWQQAKADFPRRKKEDILVHLISDAAMKKMNAKYRGKAAATDVLSFSYTESDAPVFAHEPVGEVYISLKTAARQAKVWNMTLAEELCILAAHGTLHVLGYDHEGSEAEMKKMRTLEKKVLKAAGLSLGALTQR